MKKRVREREMLKDGKGEQREEIHKKDYFWLLKQGLETVMVICKKKKSAYMDLHKGLIIIETNT